MAWRGVAWRGMKQIADHIHTMLHLSPSVLEGILQRFGTQRKQHIDPDTEFDSQDPSHPC